MSEGSDSATRRPSYWRAVLKRHRIPLIASVAAVLVGGSLSAALLLPRDVNGPVARGPEASVSGPVATESTATSSTPSSPESTVTTGITATQPSGGLQPPPAATGAPAPVRARLVAYRRDGWLCVADEGGGSERRVTASAAGVFVLSPDGSTLAFADATAGVLQLADVASGRLANAGPVLQEPLSWSRDSEWLVGTASGPTVVRVPRAGAGGQSLGQGDVPAASVSDGTVVAAAVSGGILSWRDGRVRNLPATATLTALACDGETAYYGAIADSGASLRSVSGSGNSETVLVSAPSSPRPVTFGDLMLSPDGSWLAYAERGDDGYSRLFAIPAAGGRARSLCVRHDCYPLGWSADGSRVFFIEGNALQGEHTVLMSVEPSGEGRTALVDGATR